MCLFLRRLQWSDPGTQPRNYHSLAIPVSPWTTTGDDISSANVGNVGIGLVAPGEELSVGGDLQIVQSSAWVGRAEGFSLGISGTEMRAMEFNYAQTGTPIAKISATNYNSDGSCWYTITDRHDAGLTFSVINNGVMSDSMWLINWGNVGIGTNTPSQKLDVNGGVRIRGGSPSSGHVLTATDAGNAEWQAPSGIVCYGEGFTGIQTSALPGIGWDEVGYHTYYEGYITVETVLLFVSFRCRSSCVRFLLCMLLSLTQHRLAAGI